MKYIDADRLRKEVRRLEKAAHKSALGCADSETRRFHEGKDFAYQYVGALIASLQHEQPEVDLEKELDQWRHEHFVGQRDGHYNGEYLERSSQLEIARHFFDLGLNARKV